MRIASKSPGGIKHAAFCARLISDAQYRIIAAAVMSLIANLAFALYNAILGLTSGSLIFIASAVYYLLLSIMRFTAVMQQQSGSPQHDKRITVAIGALLIALGAVFHIMVMISIKYGTAAVYGTIPMITIAAYTFTKITTAAITAIRQRKKQSALHWAVNAIRYAEVAVSLLTMQQSMLVSFGGMNELSAIVLNACTGAGVFLFILALGIMTVKKSTQV